MSHYGTLGSYHFATAAEDIRGSKLYGAEDKKLGKIDDVIFDHVTGTIEYAVVDTGGWLTHHKFIVPASYLRPSTEHEGDFSSELTKQRIEDLPPYQENDLKSEEKWTDYENRYRAKWEADPVMHRAETDRNITPTTQQLEGNRSSMEASGSSSGSLSQPVGSATPADVEAASSVSERVVPAGMDSVVISNSAVGIGGRWDTFQARLRERRKEVVGTCASCTVGPASERGAENVTSEKKAI